MCNYLEQLLTPPKQGVAPFRAFVQERVALARKAKEKDGPDALKDWGTMDLFYGCRRSDWDYLYKQEWEDYAKELDGKFVMHTALSREPGQAKVYVQQLVAEQADHIGDSLVNKKGEFPSKFLTVAWVCSRLTSMLVLSLPRLRLYLW